MPSVRVAVPVLWCFLTCVAGMNKVLLVSMDGFRWDYLNNSAETPNFQTFAQAGVKAVYLNPSFPTKTFPDHYTLVTGMYTETHGIIGNRMYDPILNDTFTVRARDPRWWNGGEPLWVTAKKQGLKTATYYWPGSEVEIRGVRPDIWLDYSDSPAFRERVDTVVDWFSKQEVEFATLYFPEPDITGHSFGPNSKEVKDKVKEMDSVLGYLVSKFKDNQLEDKVNIIVTSDHGMTEISNTRIVDISDYIDLSKVRLVQRSGAVVQVIPEEGATSSVFQNLSQALHVKVYLKENLPGELHFKNNRRTMPVVIIADEGWQITNNKTAQALSTSKGTHGYNNSLPSMKPIFLAWGPDFKKHVQIDSIESVDIYPMVCALLGVRPSPNNGSLDRVKDLIKIPTSTASGTSILVRQLTLILCAYVVIKTYLVK